MTHSYVCMLICWLQWYLKNEQTAVRYSVIFVFLNNGTKASTISCSTSVGSATSKVCTKYTDVTTSLLLCHQLGNIEWTSTDSFSLLVSSNTYIIFHNYPWESFLCNLCRVLLSSGLKWKVISPNEVVTTWSLCRMKLKTFLLLYLQSFDS